MKAARTRQRIGSSHWFAVLGIGWICMGTGSLNAGQLERIDRDYVVKVWDDDDGPGHISVTAFTQTPDGYLWLGTYQNLVRSDGARFLPWDPPGNPLSNQGVLSLCTDKDGALWVGSTRGVGKQSSSGEWRAFTTNAQAYPGGNVRSIQADGKGHVFATAGTSLTQFDGRAFIPVPPAPGGDTNYEMHCLVETNGVVWTHSPYYVGRFAGGQWTTVLSSEELRTRPVQGIALSRDGGLWVADERKIRKFKEGRWTQEIDRPDGFAGDAVCLLEDSLGNLWAGGYTRGVILFKKNGQMLRCTMDEGLANNATLAIFEDNENNIWIGSNGGGVARLKPRTFTVFERQAGLPQPVVNTVLETSSGTVWAGTHGSGLLPFDGQRFGKAIESADGKLTANSWVQALAEDRSGNIWVAAYQEGLFRIRGQEALHIPQAEFGTSHAIALFVDSKDRLWVGTQSGLARIEKNAITRFTPEMGVPKGTVPAITEDSSGRIWIANMGKIFKLDGDRFVPFEPAGEPPGQVVSLYGDRSGSLWVGTFSGKVGRLSGEKWSVATWKDGLPIWNTLGIQEDARGDLWLATVEGICRVTRASFDAVAAKKQARLESLRFDKTDGLLTVAARALFQPICARGSDGRIWIAMIKGLAVVDPSQIRVGSRPPPTWIEEILADGKPLDFSPGAKTRVPAGTRRIKIRYTGISLGAPEGVRFGYRLDELDKDWQDGGSERTTQFEDLRPGDYKFRVQASNREGERLPQETTLSFTVLPFFWQTGWFQFFARLAIAGTAGGSVWRVMTRRHQQERERLAHERLLAEERAQEAAVLQARKAAEMANQEKRFFAAMSQQIRTPVSSVMNAVSLLLESGLNPRQAELASSARKSTQAVFCILNTILDVSQDERQLELDPVAFDLRPLISHALGSLAPAASERHVELIVRCAPPVPERVKGDPARLTQVLMIVAGHALQFTAKGQIVLSCEFRPASADAGSAINFSVENTGVPLDQLGLLYAKPVRSDAAPGNGLDEADAGLEMARKLVDRMRGEWSVTTRPGHRLDMRFSVPLGLPATTGTLPPGASESSGGRTKQATAQTAG